MKNLIKRLFKNIFLFNFILAFLIIQCPSIASAQTQKNYHIAVLLPFTGKNKNIGLNMMAAIKLVKLDLNINNIDIIPIDSSLNQNELLIQLIASKPNIVIGPVFNSDLNKLKKWSEDQDVCIISFSNEIHSKTSKCLLVLGQKEIQAVTKVVNYANDQDYEINALLSNDLSGFEIAQYLQKHNSQIKLKHISYLGIKHKNIDYNLNKFFKNIESQSLNKKQALLIPQVAMIPYIRKYLTNKNIKILGANQFDNNQLSNYPELDGSWYASTPNKYRLKFQQHFFKHYNFQPLKISALAYDSIAIINSILDKTKKPVLSDFIRSSGYKGVMGIFKFNSDGYAERQLSIFEIKHGESIEIDTQESGFNE